MKLKKTAIDLIALARVCHVSTVDRAGTPHSVPVSPVGGGERIFFASGKGAKKVRNLRRNRKVAVVFDDYTEAWSARRGVMIQGEAKILERGPIFNKIRRLLYEKFPQYAKELPVEEGKAVIVEVTPRRSFSWGL